MTGEFHQNKGCQCDDLWPKFHCTLIQWQRVTSQNFQMLKTIPTALPTVTKMDTQTLCEITDKTKMVLLTSELLFNTKAVHPVFTTFSNTPTLWRGFVYATTSQWILKLRKGALIWYVTQLKNYGSSKSMMLHHRVNHCLTSRKKHKMTMKGPPRFWWSKAEWELVEQGQRGCGRWCQILHFATNLLTKS